MTVQPSSVVLGPPPLPRSWHPVLTRVVLLGLAALSLAVFCLIAALAPASWELHDRIGLSTTGLGFSLVMVVLARPCARADRQGVTVVNFLRRKRLEWPQIVAVNLRHGDPWVLLDLADGTTLAVVAIQPGSGRRQAVRAARELRACVDAFGTAHR